MRKYVSDRFSDGVRERLSTAQYWHWKSVKSDVQAREETGSRCRTLKQRKAGYLAKQGRAISSLEKLVMKPPIGVLAKIAGVTTDQARYACAICLQEMRKG